MKTHLQKTKTRCSFGFKSVFMTVIAIVLATNTQAQDVLWKKNFGGSNADQYASVIAVSDGIVAVGASWYGSFGNGDWTGIAGKGSYDAIIVKYDNNGNVLWKKNFGGSSRNSYNSVTEVSDGFVAVGFSNSFGTGDWADFTGKGMDDAIIVKYDNDGNVVWKKNFGNSSVDEYYSVTTVSDGVIAVGFSGAGAGFGNGDWAGYPENGGNAIIVKYNNDGNIVWKKNFGCNDDLDYYKSVIAVSDGIIAVGYSGDFGTGDWVGVTGNGNGDAIIVKYNNNGTVLWKKNFGGNARDEFSSITAVSDGFVSVGYSTDDGYMGNPFGSGDWAGVTGKGGQDAIIVKYDNNGNVLWKKNFGGNAQDEFRSVTAIFNSIVAVGVSYAASFNNGDWAGIAAKGGYDAILVEYDNDGNVLQKRNFGGNGASSASSHSSITTVSSGVVAVGHSSATSFGSGDWADITGKGNNDAIIVKYTTSTWDCEALTTGLQAQIDNLKNQLNTANQRISELESQLEDCEEEKDNLQALLDECLNGQVGVESVRTTSLLTIYPNPVSSNDVLNIESATLKMGDKIEIFDMQGNLISTHFSTGVENSVNVGNLTQGIYLLRLAGKSGIKFEVK